MYYTGLDPRTMEPVYVAKNPHEKAMQRALIQYRDPRNYDLVKEALLKAGRSDLIGFDKHCLISPRKITSEYKKNKFYRNEGHKKAKEDMQAKKSKKRGAIRNIHKKRGT